MRLDHLLSREPVFGDAHQGHACVSWCVFLVLALVHCPLCGWWVWVRGCFLVENRGASSVEANTLSGSRSTPFERLACMLLILFWCALLFCGGVGGWWCVWWVVCDLYSGCEHLLFSCCVVLFSFVGHSVDALASRADEGRCGLRYASGSWRASFDPRVSEWGNLTRVVLGYHHLNVYRVVGGTRGSETS